MCTNKVYIKNKYRQSKIGNYFACGRCPACRQAAANRRANKIRHHVVEGYTSYFVTLTYDNKYIPYVDLRDLYKAADWILGIQDGTDLSSKDFSYKINVYRDYTYVRDDFDRIVPIKQKCLLEEHEISDFTSYDEFWKLSGVRTIVYNKTTRKNEAKIFNPNKISVCHSADARKFIKRLRIDLFRSYGKNIPISYFYAPEYGPTSQRFHMHLLIWFPSEFSEVQVRHHIIKAWPYGNKISDPSSIQVARNPSNYLASYVNCSSDVSTFLLKNFPLRPSHSLHFGFDKDSFSFDKVFCNFQRGRFTYVASIPNQDGVPVDVDLLYPQYVINRYFPIFKGFNRLNRHTLIHALKDPSKYFRLSKTPTSYEFDTTTKEITPFSNPDGEYTFQTSLVDVYGNPICMTPSESNGTINRINRAYETYFAPFGYSRRQFANFVVRYRLGRFIDSYRRSQSQSNPFDCITDFINLCDLYDFRLENETIEQYLDPLDKREFDPNTMNKEVQSTYLLEQKYEKNVKQRKVNNLYSP